MREARRDRAWIFWGAYALASAALVAPLWLATFPPGVDLPQHGAQVTIALHASDADLPYRELYERNPLSQARAVHALVIALTPFFPVTVALKLVLSLALLALPLVSLRLIRSVDGDPWWVFAAFPVAYSYAFFWGFLGFVVGIPLALLLVSVAVDQVRAPTRRRLAALAALPLAVFFGHVLALAWAGIVSALLLLRLEGRDRWLSLACLAAAVPLIGAWFLSVQLGAGSSAEVEMQSYGRLARLIALPGFLVGLPLETAYAAFGGLLVASLLLAGARPAPLGWRWVPLGVGLLFYFGFPYSVWGTAFLFPRYAVFLVPASFIALEPKRTSGLSMAGRALVVALALGSGLAMSLRFAAYEREARPFQEILGHVEPGARVLGLTYDRNSDAIPYYPVYLHWVAWLQVEHRAVADFSFAEFFPNPYRYRPEHDPQLPPHIEWRPRTFRWAEHDGLAYDYFVLRHREAPDPDPFAGATTTLEMVAEHGPWSLFRQRR